MGSPGNRWLAEVRRAGSGLAEHLAQVDDQHPSYTVVDECDRDHVVGFDRQVRRPDTLTVDPGRHVFDYKLSHSPHRTRRREFALGLIELARKMDFSIIDVDRTIKGVGVAGLGDFVKFMPLQKKAIGEEVVRVLRERE